jgi:hypothetical protein
MNSSVQRENQKNYHMPVVLYSYPEPFDTIQSKISIEKNERILDESIHDEYESSENPSSSYDEDDQKKNYVNEAEQTFDRE